MMMLDLRIEHARKQLARAIKEKGMTHRDTDRIIRRLAKLVAKKIGRVLV